jgi:hypothetical protein
LFEIGGRVARKFLPNLSSGGFDPSSVRYEATTGHSVIATKQSVSFHPKNKQSIAASLNLSSGAHSRDPLAPRMTVVRTARTQLTPRKSRLPISTPL